LLYRFIPNQLATDEVSAESSSFLFQSLTQQHLKLITAGSCILAKNGIYWYLYTTNLYNI